MNDGAILQSIVGSSADREAGTHENVTVRLDEPLSAETTLVAIPHRDTGGDETYDFVTSTSDSDGPYTADGAVVAAAPVSTDERMTDESTEGSTASDMDDGTAENGTTSTPGFGVIVGRRRDPRGSAGRPPASLNSSPSLRLSIRLGFFWPVRLAALPRSHLLTVIRLAAARQL